MSKKVYVTFLTEGKVDGFPRENEIIDEDTYILAISDIFNYGNPLGSMISNMYKIYDDITIDCIDWTVINVKDSSIRYKKFDREIDRIYKRISKHISNNCELHVNTKFSSDKMSDIVVAICMYMKYVYPSLNLHINGHLFHVNKVEFRKLFRHMGKKDFLSTLKCHR